MDEQQRRQALERYFEEPSPEILAPALERLTDFVERVGRRAGVLPAGSPPAEETTIIHRVRKPMSVMRPLARKALRVEPILGGCKLCLAFPWAWAVVLGLHLFLRLFRRARPESWIGFTYLGLGTFGVAISALLVMAVRMAVLRRVFARSVVVPGVVTAHRALATRKGLARWAEVHYTLAGQPRRGTVANLDTELSALMSQTPELVVDPESPDEHCFVREFYL